jgi:putative DNA primase/helicase
MAKQGKTPPPVPGENGDSRKKKSCGNSTGGSGLAAQRPAWEQLKSLGLIPVDEQYDCMKAVASFYTNKLKSLNPKPAGSVIELRPLPAQPQAQVQADPDELPPGWNLPSPPQASRKATGQRKPAAKQQQAQAQNAADSIEVCPECFAVTRLPAAKCRECGHPFQPEAQQPPPGQGKHQQHAAGGAPPQEAQAQKQQAAAAPFEPMGQSGDAFVYRTASGELVTLPRSRHTSVCLVSLAPLGYWETLYPGKTCPNWLAAASSLFEQQRTIPPFSMDRIRGRGTWMDDGRTVLHLGDRLLVDGRPSPLHHPQTAYVYDRRPSLPELGPEPLADEAGLQVMEFIRGAGWRDRMEHLLVAGAIVLGPVGNALRLRPQLVVTAPRGAGKTEGVLEPAEALMGGPEMVLFAKGWTASAVRQSLSGDVLPVICDEWENAAKTPERRDQWGELLRVAYDGGECGRGTAHQQAIRQRVSSAFILAGINVEGMDDASRSRGVIVQKGILSQADIRQQVLAARGLAVPDLGRRLVRRTLANLPTLLQNTETIQQSLIGMDSRRADVYAHLLAGALLLVTTERLESAADAKSWLARIGWKPDAAAEEDLQQDSEGRRCLDRLLRHTVRWDELGDRSREITISELIRKALTTSTNDTKADEVKTVLGRLGVKVAAGNPWAIYVAKRCSEAIYRGTTWADGNHLGRLLDLDGAKKDEAWFPVSRKQRCVWIPQKHVDETEPAPVSQQEMAA